MDEIKIAIAVLTTEKEAVQYDIWEFFDNRSPSDGDYESIRKLCDKLPPIQAQIDCCKELLIAVISNAERR